MINPAGAATAAARPSTWSVRSSTLRTMTRPTCGGRYGGSSSRKLLRSPRSSVFESRYVTPSVTATARTTNSASSNAAIHDEPPPNEPPAPFPGEAFPAAPPERKSAASETSSGNRPLQGTKLFVSIAASLSFSSGMMRQPTTPAALQPKPMEIVSACLPHAPQQRKQRSRLKAARGRKPRSSSSVKSGKKIAIGGSMTATTQPTVRNIPASSASVSHPATFSRAKRR